MRFSIAYEQDGSRKALDVTGICSGRSAHRHFQEWTQAGVFKRLWAKGLLDYDELKGLE
jgi:putative transposase